MAVSGRARWFPWLHASLSSPGHFANANAVAAATVVTAPRPPSQPCYWSGVALAPRALSLTLLALLSTAPVSVVAQAEAPLQLRWSAPPGCPSVSQVDAALHANLRTEARMAHAGNLLIRARVTRRGRERFVLRVRFSGDLSGERELQAETCQAAADAMVLLVALAIDPEHATRTAFASPSDATNPRPGNAETPNASDAASPGTNSSADTTSTDSAPRERERPSQDQTNNAVEEATSAADDPDPEALNVGPLHVEFALGGGAALDAGSAPGATAGLHAVAEATVSRLHIALSGTWLLPRKKDLNSSASLATGWVGAGLDACLLWGGESTWGPCLGAEGGLLTLSTSGLRDSSGDNPWALFARAAVAARTRLTANLSGALWVGVHTPLSYPRLLVGGETEAFRPSVVGVRATLSLLWVVR